MMVTGAALASVIVLGLAAGFTVSARALFAVAVAALGVGSMIAHLAVTANTKTHVLSDETELDYEALLGW